MQKKMWRLCLYTRRVQVLAVCIVPVPPPTEDVISCTYKQWFKPHSPRRRYCQLTDSGRRIQRFLHFRLVCHGLSIAAGCLACSSGAISNEAYITFVCCRCSFEPAAAGLVTPHTMCSFLAQKVSCVGFELCHRRSRFHEHVTLLP